MYFTRLLFGVILTLALGLSHAEDYRVIVPLPAGNQSDLITRAIADSISRNTKDQLIVLNMPGAENTIAAMHFKNNPNIDLINTVSGMIVFNPVLKPDLPYSDKDFNHIAYVGTSVTLWVTRPNTNLKTPEDLVKHLPLFVGGYASSLNFNLNALTKEKNLKSSIVSYKGISQTMIDILNGTIDLGLLTMSGTVSSMVKSGKLHIIGSSYHEDLVVDGIKIPSVSKRLNIPQFNGFIAYASQPSADLERTAKLRKLIWDALQDPIAQEIISKTNIIEKPTISQRSIYQLYNNYRIKVAQYNKE
jgi:tripartite-type tricarboxylate transporter receptor subunit TctC